MKFFYENKGLTIRAEYGENLAFGAHLHNHIELVFMMEGRTKTIVDSEEFIVGSDDALIIFPNKIHQYQKIGLESYFITIFPPDLCPEYNNIFKNMIPASPVIKNAGKNVKILPLVRQIVEASQGKTAYHEVIIKGYFLVLLGELFQMILFEKAKSSDGNTIKNIMNYCTENYTRDIQLETVSRELHISKYYISHLFSQKLHMCFNEYIAMLRISEACRILTVQDKNIIEIAHNVGFSSVRTLNRLFLKYVGMTPREYRSRNLNFRATGQGHPI